MLCRMSFPWLLDLQLNIPGFPCSLSWRGNLFSDEKVAKYRWTWIFFAFCMTFAFFIVLFTFPYPDGRLC
jgi:hypothetical protein